MLFDAFSALFSQFGTFASRESLFDIFHIHSAKLLYLFFFAYKQTLVSANQELYKIEKYNIAFTLINCVTDIVVLLIFRDFMAYLLFKLVLVVVKNIAISNKINHEYPYLTDPCDGKLTKDEMCRFLRICVLFLSSRLDLRCSTLFLI